MLSVNISCNEEEHVEKVVSVCDWGIRSTTFSSVTVESEKVKSSVSAECGTLF